MQSTGASVRVWPRYRIRLRSIVSTTMVVGWLLAAVGGLLPYYFLPRGQGSSGEELLGMGRSVWISVHLWLSVGMVAFTVVHVLLNRRGMTRGLRLLSGSRLEASPAVGGSETKPVGRKWWGWAAVVISVTGLVLGGLAFAADHDSDGGWGGGRGRWDQGVADHSGVLPGAVGVDGG